MLQWLKKIKNKSPLFYTMAMGLQHKLSPTPEWVKTPLQKDRRSIRWLENTVGHFTQQRLLAMLPKQNGLITIPAGVFKGIKYWADNPHFFTPIGYGVYEPQMQQLIETMGDGKQFARFVNVGCAEGTYVVGLLKRWPHIIAEAYDILDDRVAMTVALAELNGVSLKRLKTGSLFDFADSTLYPAEPSLFLIDIEGCEADLVNHVDKFKIHDLLIEAHEDMAPTTHVADSLCKAFAKTHDQTVLGYADLDFIRNNIDLSPFNAGEVANLMFCNRAIPQKFMHFRSKAAQQRKAPKATTKKR